MRLPEAVQAIVITSANAIAALRPDGTTVFAVGDATAALARAHGFSQVRSASADADALARLVAAHADPHGAPLLLASGAGQGVALGGELRRRGFRVARRVCYDVVPARRFPSIGEAAILSGDLAVAVFLSAETARIFERLLPPECNDRLSSVTALAIGKTTEEALHKLPWLRIRRAETPTLDDVLALL